MTPNDPQSDARQDTQLRAVSVPPGLLERLRQAALCDDEGLDGVIREVVLPRGLIGRLREAVLADDEALDAALREVPMPLELAGRLRRVPRRWEPTTRLARWATAVSLFVAVGVTYLATALVFSWAMLPSEQSTLPQLASWQIPPPVPMDTELDIEVDGPGGPRDGLAAEPAGATDRLAVVPRIEFADPTRPAADLADASEPAADPFLPRLEINPWLEAASAAAGPRVFGSHNWFDSQPNWKKAASFAAQGIAAPTARWYNRYVLTRYGVHPFVPPADTELQRSTVPLGVWPSSYEWTRRCLEDGELPPPNKLRTEEFLAAIDYPFPRPEDRGLELHVGGGPSPFRPRLKLLEVGVQAREIGDPAHSPTHLILVVDTSASMQWGGRLEMVRRGLKRVVGQLSSLDRISLVTFSDQVQVLAQAADAQQATALPEAFAQVRPGNGTEIVQGVQRAVTLLREVEPRLGQRRRIVLLTDGLMELDASSESWLKRLITDHVQRGGSFDVVDMAQEDPGDDSHLAQLAQLAEGRRHRAESVAQMEWALLESLTDTPQKVASGARLSVRFNPKTVMAYRLLGHEPGLKTRSPEADFRAGQSAIGLYEVWLKPEKDDTSKSTSSDWVAVAELGWREPGRQQTYRLSRKIHRDAFSGEWQQASLSLQAAAIVAQTAEILRQSPFADVRSRPAALAEVRALVEQMDSGLREQPDFQEFMSVVRQAAYARPYAPAR